MQRTFVSQTKKFAQKLIEGSDFFLIIIINRLVAENISLMYKIEENHWIGEDFYNEIILTTLLKSLKWQYG